MKSLGMYFSGFIARQHREKPVENGAAVLPMFLAQSALKPFIDKHLGSLQYHPIPYRTMKGASASGIPAKAIAKICKVWMDAGRAGALVGNRQQAIARTAEIVYDGLAETGIIALVDEATGFQRDRAKNALAEILGRQLRIYGGDEKIWRVNSGMTPEQETELLSLLPKIRKQLQGLGDLMQIVVARTEVLQEAVILLGATPEMIEKRFEFYHTRQKSPPSPQ